MQTVYEDGQCLKNYLLTTLNEKKTDFDENFIKNDDEKSDKG